MTTHIALFTGAHKGIGLETARQLGARGTSVLLGARDERPPRRAGRASSSARGTSGAAATPKRCSGRRAPTPGSCRWT
ncbi:hypothetical protein ACFXGD_04565 [Streptomyces albidoflavus]